jgi:outer membrane immunogenic protein
MKKYLLVAAAAVLFPISAHAQDVPFQGLYFGAEAGIDSYELSADVDLGDFDSDFDGVTAEFDGLSGNGIAGGVYAGYQVPMGGSFVAVEAFGRLSDAGMKASFSDGTDTGFLKAEAKESYGAAARFGVELGARSAIYARVGWINTKFRVTASDGTDTVSESETEDGVQYGGGLETAIGPRTSIRAEYVVSDYGQAGLGDGVSLENGAFSAGITFRY